MYVVRIDLPGASLPDFKVYERLPDAEKRLRMGNWMALHEEARGAFLFEVPDVTDVYAAVESVRNGHALLIERDPWRRIVKAFEGHFSEAMVMSMLRMPDA